MSRTPVEQAKRDLEYFGRINFEALNNQRHPDHYEASEQYAAMTRNLVRLQGRDPNAPSVGFEMLGGPLR